MKIREFKNKDKEELIKILKDKKEELRNFRFGIAGSKTRNVKEGYAIKKDIARIMTILNLEK